MTIKAFIKNEEKKRAKESEPPPTPVVEPTPTSQPAEAQADSAVESIENSATPVDGVPTDVQDEALPTADPDAPIVSSTLVVCLVLLLIFLRYPLRAMALPNRSLTTVSTSKKTKKRKRRTTKMM